MRRELTQTGGPELSSQMDSLSLRERAGVGVVGQDRSGQAPSRGKARWLSVALLSLVLFVLSLAPRWMARDVFVTSDEDSWMRRSGGFAYGMSHGLPGRTYQNGHPGVLTMELAILGQGAGRAERFADPITGGGLVTKQPGFFDALVDARRPFALVGTALICLISLLVWRLFGAGPAITVGLLLALDPFLIAHSQLVHTDGLLAGFTCAAALCGLVRWGSEGGRRWMVAGGVLSGLALLTKVPAIYLAVFVPLAAVGLGRRRGFRALASDLGLWGAVWLITFVALWPSLWVNPVSTLSRMVTFAQETGGQPDEVGSFFLGQAMGDPGPVFYPVALAFRLTPAAVLGLLALVLLPWSIPRLLRGREGLLLALLGYSLGFLLFLTFAPKKFDRYALPLVPVLLILAAVGLWLLFRRVRLFLAVGPPWATACSSLVVLGLLQSSVTTIAWPYSMAYFNPLLGGGPVAAQLVMVGNGEGMDQVADYLNALPNPEQLWVAAHSFDLLAAKCRCDGEPLRDRAPGNADYVVLYGRRIQLRRWGPSLEQYLESLEPEHRVRINGIEMARVYRGPRS